MNRLQTPVLIIGGGATGTGLARDLALRGVPCTLVDQGDLNAGASGANHGLLHSGARYVAGDAQSAIDCRKEGLLLRRLAPHLLEDTNGLFVALAGDDEHYIADFPSLCARCEIPAREVDVQQAPELEPGLSPDVVAAYEVPDATIDPFKLAIENMAHAMSLGASLLTHSKVVGFDVKAKKIASVRVKRLQDGEEIDVHADLVINAAGAWSGLITRMAGIHLDVVFSKGTLIISQRRATQRVINRLRKPANADIIVPGGTVSVLGTTSVRVDSLDNIAPTIDEVDLIVDEASKMVPYFASARMLRAYAGVRPLVRQGGDGGDDRSVSRDMTLMAHGEHGVRNFMTITGGKLTTFRHMAERAADLACELLGVSAPCRTDVEPLPETSRWTVPGASPEAWAVVRGRDPLLCECEMVPESAVEHIASELRSTCNSPLEEIGLRSRVGKGSCQGCFCSLRVLTNLYRGGHVQSGQGLDHLRAFVNERFKGERSVLYGTQLGQTQLKEALHCALYGLELEP